jgi:hypothetical protein
MKWFARPRSQAAIALGWEGEALAAKMRLSAAVLVSLVPLGAAVLRPRDSEPWIALGAGAAVVALGTIVLAL